MTLMIDGHLKLFQVNILLNSFITMSEVKVAIGFSRYVDVQLSGSASPGWTDIISLCMEATQK